jgi:hypothetical protein
MLIRFGVYQLELAVGCTQIKSSGAILTLPGSIPRFSKEGLQRVG